MLKTVCIIVPVYNEQDNVLLIADKLLATFKTLPYNFYLLFVDDGSNDKTLENIVQLQQSKTHIKYISFSKNFGHQYALKAGLDHAEADCTISMDGDMQHPPQVITQLLAEWENGYEVVYTIRNEGNKLPLSKKISSDFFYKLLNSLSNIDIEKGTADFRLLDKKVVAQLKQINETDLFFRGLVKWVGFKQKSIAYTAADRYAGKSKYTVKKMIRLALQGITSFSTKPLYIATYLGFVFSLASLLFVPYAVFSYYYGKAVSGWTSVIVTIAFFGGLQLMILGILGLYLGKLFMQSKGRPLYIIKESNIHA